MKPGIKKQIYSVSSFNQNINSFRLPGFSSNKFMNSCELLFFQFAHTPQKHPVL